MKNLINSVLAITCTLVVACNKEVPYTEAGIGGKITDLSAAKEAQWQGVFLSYNGLPPTFSVPDNNFINDGYARIYSKAFRISKQNYYSTKFSLTVPSSIKLKGDSLNFEVGVKNPLNSAFYSPANGRDVTLYIKGTTNEASITNVATSDVEPGAQARAGVQLGQTSKNNIPELQYNFEDYGTFILQTFNRGVVAYRNDTYLGGLAYGNEPLIGRLKEIGIIFKGSGYIDYVKIYNSVNGKLLMSENFDTEGQSTVVWY